MNNLVPVSYNKIYTLRDDIGKTKEEINIPTGTFYDGIDGYVLRIDSKDDKTGYMHGVMVYDHTANKGNVSVTLADSAMIKMSKSKDYLTFQLFSGTNYQETNNMSYRDTSLQLQRINFRQQDMIIPLQNYAFQKSDKSKFGDQVKAMSLSQLRHGKDSLTNLNDSTRTVNLAAFMSKKLLRYSNQLDTAAHYQSRTPLEPDDMSWKNRDQEVRAYENAARIAEDFKMAASGYENDVYSYLYILRRTDVELLKKFAEALACFLLFFIGAPSEHSSAKAVWESQQSSRSCSSCSTGLWTSRVRNWHVTERLPRRQVLSSLQSSWHLWASISHGKRHMTPQYSTLRTSVHGGGK